MTIRTDIICGGFPCQDLSVAGKRAGLGGARSGLFHEAIRIVRELRPALVVIENVPGLISSNRGRDFLTVLSELRKCGAVDIAFRVVDSQYFGVAQRRRRVFIVADFAGERAGEILFESPCGCGHPPARCEAGAGVAGSLGSGAKGSGWRDDLDRSGAFIQVAHALTACRTASGRMDPNGETFVTQEAFQCHGSNVGPMGTLRRDNGSMTSGIPFVVNAAESCAKKDHARESETARCLDQTGGFAANQGGTVVAFDWTQGGQASNPVPTRSVGTGLGIPSAPAVGIPMEPAHGETAFCLPASGRGTGDGHGRGWNSNYLAGAMSVRRLTPTECERLQSFPDGWTDLDGMSDSARYRMLGNAVTVNVAEWIGRRIRAVCPGLATFTSLFAGIEGFGLGFERSGLRCVQQVEKDADCLRVLAHHWPNVPKHDDVRTFSS